MGRKVRKKQLKTRKRVRKLSPAASRLVVWADDKEAAGAVRVMLKDHPVDVQVADPFGPFARTRKVTPVRGAQAGVKFTVQPLTVTASSSRLVRSVRPPTLRVRTIQPVVARITGEKRY
jgi:hypothetical protein